MSYDILLVTPDREPVELSVPHDLRGGTYAQGGTTEAWLNVTYNYSDHFYRVMGERGIRSIYGLTAEDSIPVLALAIEALGTDEDPDYWKSTEGNARRALVNLHAIATAAIRDGHGAATWTGD